MKIVCVGRNYVEHIEELNNEIPTEPVYFIKPQSAITNEIHYQEDLHYEGEICFLIGNPIKVGVGLDLTKRALQSRLKEKGLPWERAKAFKGSALFSDFVSVKNFEGLRIELFKNGTLVQSGDVDLMIYKPAFLMQDIDAIFGLEEGDILMTGTPKGVGKVDRNDTFEAKLWQGDTLLIQKIWRVV
ncbi:MULTISPECIES: fumarylacetoacetate hydrolase family protein [unclassified Nitratiruptor]|uniref:fumarylacetoacetate hydrolase family protein n=1 Tax=unclassified Nitratiruptor TaxID=2624044 RepID=UPI00191648CA|nr:MULTISPECIES: fumarylacetoacetate hydrolase family protein [unclassified Nitratiruptor]BCD60762.1 2-keto-4-pentenoate hydratase [Nitratiruptor sp. YY08-10]BCD64694.1 2-keto-4-pentenoate hydratase [Nitratiruptor sp. YY08-14]